MGESVQCACLCGCKNSFEIDLDEIENALSALTVEDFEDLSEEEIEKSKSNLATCKQCQNGFHVTRFE